MKRWVILLCLLALIFSVTQAEAYSIAGTVTGGQSNLLMLRYVIAIPLRLDTANFLSNLGVANPFGGYHYSLSGLDSGNYIIVSFQDIHESLPPIPQLDDPRGFWMADTSTGIPTILNLVSDTSGINIRLSPPNSGGFTGTTSYDGTQRGRTYVIASHDSLLSDIAGIGTMLDTTSDGNGSYTALTDTFGTYYAYAYLDVNGNFIHDSDEPYGVYGGTRPQGFTIQQSSFPNDINITMTDPVPNAVHPSVILQPSSFSLSSYPNPFNSTATVTLQVSMSGNLSLSLFDVLGREVQILARGSLAPGEYRYTVDGSRLSTGVYFLRLSAVNTTETRPIILLK